MNLNKIDQNQAEPSDADRMNRDVVEAHIVAMLEHYKRVNEGANAIIGLVNFSELDDRLIDYFFNDKGKEKPENEKLALKMLKVYSDANLAKAEGELQLKARELLLDNQIEGVGVPDVYFCDAIAVESETLLQHLESEGLEIKEDNAGNKKIGVLVMNFIDGDDMLAYLYKEVIKKYQVANPEENKKQLSFAPELGEVDQHLEHGDLIEFSKLRDRTSLAIDLKIGNKNDPVAQHDARLDNIEKVVKFLANNDFVIDPKVIDQIEAAVMLFHRNGLYHRDLHERNIIFSFDENDKNKINKVNIIDFGNSIITTPGNEDVYQEDDKIYPNDSHIVWSYKKLTKPKEVFEQDEFFTKLEKTFKNIKNNPERSSRYDLLIVDVKKLIKSTKDNSELMDDLNDLVKDFANDFIKEYVAPEDNFNLNLATWRDVVGKYPKLKNNVIERLSALLSGKPPLSRYAANTLMTFLDYLKK